jgi:hypothetical protein
MAHGESPRAFQFGHGVEAVADGTRWPATL